MMDFYAHLKKQIPGLVDLSASSRGTLYRSVLASNEKTISEAKPPLPMLEAAAIRMTLDEAIKRIESEFVDARERYGKHAPDWAIPPGPPAAPRVGLDSSGARADAGPSQRGPSAPPGPPEEWDAPVRQLAPRRNGSDPAPPGTAGNLAAHLRIVNALLVRYIKTAAGTEKPAYFWLTIEPLLQVGLVVSLYWLFGRTLVYGMPAVPFAIIGVGGWLMFRTMLMRVSTGMGREFVLCYFPIITRFDIYLSKSVFFGISYFLATIAMLFASYYFELSGATVKNPAQFAALWLLIWAFSFGFALTLNYIFVLIPAISRMLLILMRGLYLVSAVVVVTEQFSTEDKALFLWNPLVHGMQLLRSAYFYEYSSDDASLLYFVTATVVVMLFGLIGERAQRRREVAP